MLLHLGTNLKQRLGVIACISQYFLCGDAPMLAGCIPTDNKGASNSSPVFHVSIHFFERNHPLLLTYVVREDMIM